MRYVAPPLSMYPRMVGRAAVALLTGETTTLGVRRRTVERHVAEREIVIVKRRLAWCGSSASAGMARI
jgi:Protein of unknown function DUF111